MKIKLNSVFVDDQEKALRFYTEALGFVKKMDIPMGSFRWLTVVSPDEPDGTELVLEPEDNPSAQNFTRELRAQGIPLTAFEVADLHAEYKRLTGLGVDFILAPTETGPITRAILDDTCGNLIQLYQVNGKVD